MDDDPGRVDDRDEPGAARVREGSEAGDDLVGELVSRMAGQSRREVLALVRLDLARDVAQRCRLHTRTDARPSGGEDALDRRGSPSRLRRCTGRAGRRHRP